MIMGKKEKFVIAIVFVLIFLELMKYEIAVKVVILGLVGYQVYTRWKRRQ